MVNFGLPASPSRPGLRVAASASALIALALVAGPANANDVLVTNNGGISNLKRGEALELDRRITIPSGRILAVMLQQEGKVKTVQIRGPREGLVRDLVKAEAIPSYLFERLKDLARTGGSSETGYGGARGAQITINLVGIVQAPHSYVICVEDGQLPLVGLGTGIDRAAVRVHNTSMQNTGVSFELSRDKPRAAWPSSVGVRDNNVYRLIGDRGLAADIRLRTVPSGTMLDLTQTKALALLLERGCKAQLDAAALQNIAKPQPLGG